MRRKPEMYALLGLYLALKAILLLKYHDVRWDEAVFLNMSTHLLSGGAAGYWESLRPPLYPIALSVLDIIGEPVLLAELLNTALALAAAWLVYDLLEEEIGRTYAAYGALTLLLVDVWFWYSSMLFTGIPSAFLLILACWLYTKEHHALAGIASAAAFLTRFPAGLVLPAISAGYAYKYLRGHNTATLKHAAKYLLGFGIPVAAWLAINSMVWHAQLGWLHAAVYPLVRGGTNAITQNLWVRDTDTLFYITHAAKSIPLLLLAIPGLYWLKDHDKLIPLATTGVLAFAFFTFIDNNQWRFAILLLPGLIALLFIAAHHLRRHAPRAMTVLIILNLLVVAGTSLLMVNDRAWHAPEHEDAYRFLQEHPSNGTLLTTDPVAAHYADTNAIPLYYEFRNINQEHIRNASRVFLVPQHLPCAPNNTRCEQDTQRLIDTIHDTHSVAYEQHTGGYDYYVLEKTNTSQ